MFSFNFWALDPATFASLQARLNSSFQPEAAAQSSQLGNTSNNDGRIAIRGVLVPEFDRMMSFFGVAQTTYSSIVRAIQAADSDPSVRRIVLDVDSPGGAVSGLSSALSAIAGASKPVDVIASRALSAAYAIAAAATGRIMAVDDWSQFGSVGVVTSIPVDQGVVTITSTDAPKKRPDATTEAGRADVRAELDAFHELLVSGIAAGRKLPKAVINSNFGRGASLVAKDALSRGMIDGIGGASSAGGSTAQHRVEAPSGDLQDQLVAYRKGLQGGGYVGPSGPANPAPSHKSFTPTPTPTGGDMGDQLVAYRKLLRQGNHVCP